MQNSNSFSLIKFDKQEQLDDLFYETNNSSPSDEAFKLLGHLKESLNEFSTIKNDPFYFIYEKISNVRNKIDLQREILIKNINCLADQFLNQLNNFQNECKQNFQTCNKQVEKEVEDYFKVLDIKYSNWENELSKRNEMEASKICDEIKKTSKFNEFKLIEFKNNLLNSKGCDLIFPVESSPQDEDYLLNKIFGQLKIDKSLSVRKNQFDLYYSNILSSSQTYDLIKLCELDIGKLNFHLVYRATRDGFDSRDFHQKCDKMGKTLSIVKVKDWFIFGGYTEQEWESSGVWKEDKNAYIFSLTNIENKPVKMAIETYRSAIYCDQFSGPSFGGGCDFKIVSNSNASDKCYAKLGCSYKHPNHEKHSSNYFQSFLAGSCLFKTTEVEVYQVC